jgi:hypothetical protein
MVGSYTHAVKELQNGKQSWQINGSAAEHNQTFLTNNIRDKISESVYLTVHRNAKNVNCNSFYDKKLISVTKLLKTLVII